MNTYLVDENEKLRDEIFRLMEHIAMLKKDGYTYDQVTRKVVVCDVCFKAFKDAET